MKNDKVLKIGIEVDTRTGQTSIKNLSSEFNNLKTSGKESLDEVGNSSDKTSSAFGTLKAKAIAATAAIAVGIYTAKKAFDVASMGSKLQQEAQSFKNLAESYGESSDKILKDLKRLSAGTISTSGIINQAGTAMMMGIAPDKLADLMKIARVTARQTGQDVSKAFGDIALAVGRQSKMILDNLGIILDVGKANKNYAEAMNIVGRELTDVEKKQAFINATMASGKNLMARIGDEGITTAEAFQAFGSQVADLKDGLSKLLANAIEPLIAPLATAVKTLNDFIDPERSTLNDMAADLENLRAQLLPLTTQQQGFLSATLAGMKVNQKAAAEVNKKTLALMGLINALEGQIRVETAAQDSIKKNAELTRKAREEIEKEKEAVKEAAEAKVASAKLTKERIAEISKLEEQNLINTTKLQEDGIEREKSLLELKFQLKKLKIQEELDAIKEGSVLARELAAQKHSELYLLTEDHDKNLETLEQSHQEKVNSIKEEALELAKNKDTDNYEGKLESLAEYHEAELESNQNQQDAIAGQDDLSIAQLELLKEKKLAIERKYASNVLRIEEQAFKAARRLMTSRLKAASGLAGGLSDIAKMIADNSGSHAKKAFEIYKAFAIGESTIAGFSAAVKAWDSGMSTGGPYAPAIAAAYTAASLIKTGLQISNISGQSVSGYAHGGVVNSPTYFNDGSGSAVMGEVPGKVEGILPLATVGGDLGVKATGLGSTNNFYINVNSVDALSFQELCNRNPEVIIGPIVEAFNQGHGSLINATVESMR